MWIIGGPIEANGVWNSSDGISWSFVGNTPRTMNHTAVVHNGKIFVIGGQEGSSTLMNEVLVTEDGINWTTVDFSETFTPRSSHTSVVYKNRIWVLGGAGNNGLLMDVWYLE
jgi:hypothetical protein